ncbi:MAG: ABC transporter ATP-binding protein [Proteobacteria bacterium]|nr:ABC transporter ATP-binding protein [Pseudomonadota bacterium]
MEIAATIRNLNKDFQVGDENVRILHDIVTDIRMGELTMLVGPSGCGKTTLISIISGILSPTSGVINLLGYDLSRMTDGEKVIFRRTHIGFIFQQYNLLPALTAAENAAMPLFAADVPHQEAISQATEILNQIGMSGQTEKLPRQLSGGQQQRVAIARALVHHPNFIVCDEPTAALDAKTGKGVMEILTNIAKDKNRAVLIVTHDNRIYHFADRILEMSDGRLMGDHKPQNFIYQE